MKDAPFLKEYFDILGNGHIRLQGVRFKAPPPVYFDISVIFHIFLSRFLTMLITNIVRKIQMAKATVFAFCLASMSSVW